MATANPDDKKQPARVAHTGHGSASLIPHLRGKVPPAEPEPADAATQEPVQQPPGQQPQAE
jgi:hypothetical protein